MSDVTSMINTSRRAGIIVLYRAVSMPEMGMEQALRGKKIGRGI
jgi:hypothetical protein